MIEKIKLYLHNISNRKSVLRTWLVSYIAIIFMMLMLVLWAENMLFDVIVEDTVNLKMEEINTFSSKMDTLTEECKLFAVKLVSDERFTENFLNVPEDAEKHFDLKGSASSLRKEMKYVDEFFVYLKDEQQIINSSGYICTPRHYYDIYYKKFDIEYNEWLEKLLNGEYAGYQVFENNLENGMKRLAKFCYKLPLKQMLNKNAVVFTEVNFSSYEKELIKLDSHGDMSVLIYDENSNRYFEKGNYIPSGVQLKNSEENGTFYETKINGEKVMLKVLSSAFASWKYAFVIPHSIFWSKIISIKRVGNVIFLLIAVLGVLGMWLITKYNYKAVAKIIKRIESNFEISGNKSENEYARINKIIDVASKYSMSVEEQEKQKRINTILKLLLGAAGKTEIKDGEKLFYKKYFVVAVFSVPSQEAFKEDNITDMERAELMKTIVVNIFTELIEPYGSIEAIDMDNMTFVFSPADKYRDTAGAVVKKHAERAYRTVLEHFAVKLSCGISSCTKSVSELCVLYREALSALNTISEDGVNVYSKKNVLSKNYYYPIDQMQHIISLISEGEGENALKQISIILEINSAVFENKNLARALINDIAATIMRAAINVGYKIDAEKLMECIDFSAHETVSKIFKTYVNEICEFVSGRYDGKRKTLIDKIDAIIQENFKNTQFNVNMLADIIGMNANSLSVIYKRKTDNNILETINKLRIKEAKLLLKKSTDSLEDIASKVGFGSIATFRRVFKSSTGISPAEYRKMKTEKEV